MFPNPASDKITVSFDYKGGETEFTYKIYSLNGQMFSEGTTRLCFDSAQQPLCGSVSITTEAVGKIEIDICDLYSGYFMIQLWGGGKIFTGKFVKN